MIIILKYGYYIEMIYLSISINIVKKNRRIN